MRKLCESSWSRQGSLSKTGKLSRGLTVQVVCRDAAHHLLLTLPLTWGERGSDAPAPQSDQERRPGKMSRVGHSPWQ